MKHAINKALAVPADRIRNPVIFDHVDTDTKHHA
jgi:hypothetical protein